MSTQESDIKTLKKKLGDIENSIAKLSEIDEKQKKAESSHYWIVLNGAAQIVICFGVIGLLNTMFIQPNCDPSPAYQKLGLLSLGYLIVVFLGLFWLRAFTHQKDNKIKKFAKDREDIIKKADRDIEKESKKHKKLLETVETESPDPATPGDGEDDPPPEPNEDDPKI